MKHLPALSNEDLANLLVTGWFRSCGRNEIHLCYFCLECFWQYCYLNNVSEKFVSSVWKCYNMQVDRTLISPTLDWFLPSFSMKPWVIRYSKGLIHRNWNHADTAAIAVAWLIIRLMNNLVPLPLDLHSGCHHALQTCVYKTLLSPSSLSPQLLWSNRLDYCKSLSKPPFYSCPMQFFSIIFKKQQTYYDNPIWVIHHFT